ncbi:helix-turn-helix domain-containing protein [Olleya sp. HaHaR_3_96]|nr:helix-turn-helix domain-containing protein [Olleya sp. HaHaR_3_96]
MSLHQRYQIQCLLQNGFKQTKTASKLGVNKRTIPRALQRSLPKHGIIVEYIHLKASKRHGLKLSSFCG